jgi:hypothetical protein
MCHSCQGTMVLLEHLHQGPVSDTAKCFLGTKVLVTKFISNPTHKIGTRGLPVGGGRLLITTHLDQSNCLANEKQGTAVNKIRFE